MRRTNRRRCSGLFAAPLWSLALLAAAALTTSPAQVGAAEPAAAGTSAAGANATKGAAAAATEALGPLVGGTPAHRVVHEYWLHLANEAMDRREAAFEQMKTPADVKKWQERLRAAFLEALGELPERTPLNPRVVGVIEREGYRVEKVIYESRPKHFVTAVLFLPEGKGPFPGVIVPCGHSANGKASEGYQQVCIMLAKAGIAALCYDPIDQGERIQLFTPDGKPAASNTTGHCITGLGAILLGQNTATYRVWDGFRSLDYLASRPEIDPARLGCTGNSGGGTLTSYLMALDDRILAAAPGCYLCGFRRLLATIGPQDAEQNIFGQLAFGMDHADYVLTRAPKPTVILAATGDFFAIDGTWPLFREAKRTYTRLGAPHLVDMVEADEKHGYTAPLRLAAVQFFRRHLLGIDGPAEIDPNPAPLPEKEILCTPEGQVMRLPEARSVYDINRETAARLAPQRERLWRERPRDQSLAAVRRLTGIRPIEQLSAPEVKRHASRQREGYRIDLISIELSPQLWLPALAFVPEKPAAEACLYLHELGKSADAGPDGPIEKLVRQGQLILAVDLTGCGELRPTHKGNYGGVFGPNFNDAYTAYLLGRSFLAHRAEEIYLCLLALPKIAEITGAGKPADGKAPAVHLVAIGEPGPAALHAVALAPERFASLRLEGSLKSYAELIEKPLEARPHFVSIVHGALREYDLPDLLGSLPPGKAEVVER